MILDALIGLVVAILEGILAMLPSFTLGVDLTAFGELAGQGAGIIGAAFPVAALGICILALVAVRVGSTLWNLVVFIYDRLPWKAT